MTNIKTTHVGSLPRPAEMMRKTLRRETITQQDLRHYLTEQVERQVALGISWINNGELPRADYVRATVDRISGFGGHGTAPLPQDMEDLPEYARRFGGRNGLITLNPKAVVRLPACNGQLSYTGQASLRGELEMLISVFDEVKLAHPQTDAKLFFTSPSPGTVALFMENQFYPDDETYLAAMADVLKQEYEMIAGYGVDLQVDCPDLAMGRHTRFKQLSDEQFLARIETHVRVLNRALSSIDPDRVRIHVCWGNYPGTHHCDVDLATIFEPVMAIRARYISIEASNHRHAHEWRIFERHTLPADKVLMPGVIDTSSTIVEHPELVAQRIANYARVLGADRVIASTDCGFATTASATSVTGEVAWRKLAAMVEGAKIASRGFAE